MKGKCKRMRPMDFSNPAIGDQMITPPQQNTDYNFCDVCGATSGEIRVAASSVGPVSFGYCSQCRECGAEPFQAVALRIGMIGGPESASIAEMQNVVTFDGEKYVGLDAVLAQYAALEEDLRPTFLD